MEGAEGEATYCSGKDTSGDLKEAIEEFNKANPGSTIKLVEFPEDAQQQHDQFTQRQRAKSADCDGFEEDVVWTAEFAQQKWLYDMTPYVESRKDEFIPSTLESVTYDGKNWGAPRVTDSGLLFYRTDQVDAVPATWQERLCRGRQERRHRLPGLGVRGSDGQLPRARVRRRRQRPLRGRLEVDDQLAREPQGACSSWSTASRTALRRRP